MNRELMLRVADRIENDPDFSMPYYLNKCGSSGCIAGETVLEVLGQAEVEKRLRAHHYDGWCHGFARDALWLDDEQADCLFGDDNWWCEALDDPDKEFEDISAVEAAKVLRRIADGDLEL